MKIYRMSLWYVGTSILGVIWTWGLLFWLDLRDPLIFFAAAGVGLVTALYANLLSCELDLDPTPEKPLLLPDGHLSACLNCPKCYSDKARVRTNSTGWRLSCPTCGFKEGNND